MYFRKAHPDAPAETVRLVLKCLSAGACAVEVQRVGYNERDAYSAYLRLGSPTALTPAQVRTLQAATQPAPTVQPAQRLAAGAALTQTLALRTNEVVLLRR
ncbi:hypothetical protein E4631_14290 [Hymenobacter sp. UV11]|uniref:hypothetical protein n=1 Tax=Hymenobacter sp. UV11 TaxID=1849735 RepID=UPI0010617D0E|nr:hypothetical protein [Hymenobacter sp. UV11]TDN39501.1 hypothetical protein A8B98_19925 [Hymenobacter sp. UV11]TFZ65404.1 hypothetical protein E4631_14290 [Hymenobacter sp. UV11]